MTVGTRLQFDSLRSLAYTSLTSTYVAVGSALTHPASQILVQNLTDVTCTFSLDGVNDHFVLPTLGFFLDDITTNKTSPGGGLYLPIGARLWAKTSGSPSQAGIYFTVTYITSP
jgi:hypothetical protein